MQLATATPYRTQKAMMTQCATQKATRTPSESKAVESHVARLESITTEIQSAIVVAIAQIQRATEAECATQKVTLDC
jgi:hypothetical protein